MKKALSSGLALATVLAVAFSIVMAVPAVAAVNSVVQTLGVDPTVTYADGTLYYTVILTNRDILGANNATVDLTFYPPGPTGAVDYGSPIVLDTDKFIAVGESITYTWVGGGGDVENSGLEVDLGAIPLNPGVTLVYGASTLHADYVAVPPYWADDEKNIPAQVIYPEPCIAILKLVDCNDDEEYLHRDTGSYGDTPSWYIGVWNCGDSPLLNVMVSDTNGMSWGPFDLDIAEEWEVTYDGDPIYKTTTNTAEAIAEDETGGTVGPVYDSATNNIHEVGGTVLPVNKLVLLAPWAVLAGALGVMTLLMIRKRRQA